MNKVEQLERIKRRVGQQIGYDLLSACYDDASAAICEYCNRDTVPDAAAGLLRELTIRLISANDRRGIASRSEGAISETYTSEDIPAGLQARLNHFRLLKAVKRANDSKKS